MIAIGLWLFVVGWLVLNVQHNQHTTTKMDYVGGAIAFIGMFTMLCGICIWLWRNMP